VRLKTGAQRGTILGGEKPLGAGGDATARLTVQRVALIQNRGGHWDLFLRMEKKRRTGIEMCDILMGGKLNQSRGGEKSCE